MPATVIVLIAVAAALAIGTPVVCRFRKRLSTPADDSVDLRRNPHSAPDEPYTADEAHEVWQDHRDCERSECAAKATAFQTLVDARKVVPSVRVQR